MTSPPRRPAQGSPLVAQLAVGGMSIAVLTPHPAVGERILSAVPAMASAAELVRSSHERWDGEGYPNRLAGERIPLGARIVAVADAFSAMTEERTYRKPRSKAAALEELRRCAGTQFDPRVVDAFIEAFESTPSESQVEPELATT